MVPEEISFIVSSDPENGAINRNKDGSSFEIQFDDGLEIPKDALNVNVSVEEATVWWVVPNIIEGVNDKMYITGEGAQTVEDSISLGYAPTDTYEINLGTLTINGVALPTGTFQIGSHFRVDSGALSGNSYEITGITTDTTSQQVYTITPNTDTQAVGANEFSRITDGAAQQFIITVPQGLYDLSGLNQAILRELENAGARTDPEPLIVLSPDDATQKVEIRFNYPDVSIDFTPIDTFREILGFDSLIYGPYPNTPYTQVAPNTAAFNQVNYFLLESDLVNKGIRFNNQYNQIISQVLINVAPGSQIISTPFNPARTNAQELAGSKRTNLRFRLTDDKNRSVNTNGEFFTARIVIHYLKPYVIR